MSDQHFPGSGALTSGWSAPVCASCGRPKPTTGAAECCGSTGPTPTSTTTFERSDSTVGCLTPWPEMGEAMRVYDAATGKPTVKPHNILIFTIQDTRAMEKAQNGMGVAEGNVAYTLDQTGAQGVAIVTEKQDRSLKDGVPTSSRIYDAEAGVAPTLQAANSPNRGGTDGPIVLTNPNQSTSSAADSRAKTSPSPESEQDSPETDPGSFSSSPESQMSFDQLGSSLKTSLGSSPLPTDETWESFSQRWAKSGMAAHGQFTTLATSESPNDAVECLLSDVLETTVPERYALSARAARGILRRADARGKTLPPELEEALRAITTASSEPSSGEAGSEPGTTD